MKKLDKMSRTVGYLEKLYRLINENTKDLNIICGDCNEKMVKEV